MQRRPYHFRKPIPTTFFGHINSGGIKMEVDDQTVANWRNGVNNYSNLTWHLFRTWRGETSGEAGGCPFVAALMLFVLVGGAVRARDLSKGDGPANSATRSVHEEAVRILGSIQLTEYRHTTDIDEKKGAYYCDCSGFVGYVLNRTVAKDDGKGPFHDGRKRPLAM